MALNMTATAVVQAGMDSMIRQALMPADCAMHMQPPTDDVAVDQGNCDMCELCMAVANLTFASWADTPPARHSAPLAFDASFSNAARALNLKPPIS